MCCWTREATNKEQDEISKLSAAKSELEEAKGELKDARSTVRGNSEVAQRRE